MKFDAKQYNGTWKAFELIQWNLRKPLSSARRYDNKLDKLVSARDVMDLTVPIKKGDRIAIVYYDPCLNCESKKRWKSVVVLSEPFSGKSTVQNVLEILERGLNQPIQPGNRGGTYYFDKERKYNKNTIVYDKISGYFDGTIRLSLIKKYEAGRLKPVELLGDHVYFEGMRRRGKNIEYLVGS